MIHQNCQKLPTFANMHLALFIVFLLLHIKLLHQQLVLLQHQLALLFQPLPTYINVKLNPVINNKNRNSHKLTQNTKQQQTHFMTLLRMIRTASIRLIKEIDHSLISIKFSLVTI